VVKRDRTVGKVLYAVFFRSSGLVQAVKLEGQKSVTALWYTIQCLPKVFGDAIEIGLILHHDNASSHTVSLTSQYLANNNIKAFPNSIYSTNWAMCDFWLFAELKRNLRGRSVQSEEEFDVVVLEYLNSIPESGWRGAFDIWESRIEWCVEHEGDYFCN
jgi:histone-lysine N-methyltransferase SETMAR